MRSSPSLSKRKTRSLCILLISYRCDILICFFHFSLLSYTIFSQKLYKIVQKLPAFIKSHGRPLLIFGNRPIYYSKLELITLQELILIDYMQAEQTFIPKTFELCNELSGKIHTFSIQVPYLPSSRQINMSRAISNISSSGLNLNNCHIFYLDFSRKLYVHIGCFPFKQEVYLKYELFLDSSIKIRFRNITNEKTQSCAQKQANEQKEAIQKKKKVKERTIRQAREYTNYWRNLYEQVDNKGKRIYTLESAAAKVGLAKKTLDDYYYQIRQGEYYGFNFKDYEHEKIGVLRRFIRIQMEREGAMVGEPVAPDDDIDKYLGSSDSQDDQRYK